MHTLNIVFPEKVLKLKKKKKQARLLAADLVIYYLQFGFFTKFPVYRRSLFNKYFQFRERKVYKLESWRRKEKNELHTHIKNVLVQTPSI